MTPEATKIEMIVINKRSSPNRMVYFILTIVYVIVCGNFGH